MKKLLSILFIASLLGACNSQQQSNISNNYFDLKSFLDGEIAQLNKTKATVLKVASVNGDREENRFIDVDWKREFDSFYSADIHGSSLNEKYVADTSRIINDSTYSFIIRYVAIDESVKTRVLEIHFDKNQSVTEIKAELYSKNFVANLSESLDYKTGDYYSISNHEESRWFGSDDFVIEGRIETSSPHQ